MRHFGWLFIVFAATLVAACGRGGDDDTVSVDVTPDFGALPDGLSEDDAATDIATIFERRAEFHGGSVTSRLNDNGTITVEAKDILATVMPDLFGQTGWLSLQEPRRVTEGTLVCESADGAETSVPLDSVSYPVTNTTRLPRCVLEGDVLGDIVWEPALGPLGEHLDSSGISSVSLSTTVTPTLVVQFDTAEQAVLQAISTRLVGLPLGIFIDGEMVGGPTVGEPILDGKIIISGLSLRDARILGAQLQGGRLPVAVSVSDASD